MTITVENSLPIDDPTVTPPSGKVQSTTANPAIVVADPASKQRFANDEEVKACRRMVASLSDDEKETAARSSYRYFMASTSSSDGSKRPSNEERDGHALATARRHLVAEKGDEQGALKKMKATIKYRVEMNVDAIRRCFHDADAGGDADLADLYKETRRGLEDQLLLTKKQYVRGYSKDNRALMTGRARLYNNWNPEYYMKANIYTLERAIACTERATNGAEEKVVVLFDYNGYTSKNSPPLSLVKNLVFTLRDHWPERLEYVFIVDAPLIFRGFWTLIKPFIDPVTKKKVQFVTGEEQKREVLGQVIDEEEAEPYMLPGGRKVGLLDMERYLREVPYDRAYDEVA